MIFNLFVPIKPVLLRAGYKYRKSTKDYIRWEGKDRFHIYDKTCKYSVDVSMMIIKKQRFVKVERTKKKMHFNIDIHYDLTIDGKHSVFHMPILIKEEVRRIRKFTKSPTLSTVQDIA